MRGILSRLGHLAHGRFARWITRASMALVVFAVVVIGLAYAALEWAAPTLPFHADLYALNRPVAYTFKDERGEVIGRRGARVGDRLTIADMPAYLPAAFLVMEDRRFYSHGGIDFRGLARAALADFKAKRLVQGGSTITQQLVKILFLTPDRTVSRKLVEMAGARELERLLTKDQILELYLNRIYLGAGAYGVDGAARAYFGKSARDVTVAEAAMLATLTNAPSVNSPRRDLKAAQQRSARVLRAMVSHGGMSEADIAGALAHPATIAKDVPDLDRGYFLDAAAEEASTLVPNATSDLTIVTTFDAAMQRAAKAAVADVLNKRGEASDANQAALVAMRPDGMVRAIIGGRNYAESSFNRATNAHRSPGSAFKPMVYLTALEQGLARNTIRYDEPIQVADYAPENFGQNFIGPVTLEDALVRSINTVAVGLGQEVGLDAVISTAKRLGIKSDLQPNASLALGTSEVTPLELTAAYASFASLGFEAASYTVTEIRAADGRLLYQRASREPRRVIAEDDVLAMNAMLFQVVQSGTGRAAALGKREVGGKTGTSADFRDAWFIGYTPDLIAGVWVGNDDFAPMKRVTGGVLPAQIWRGFMQVVLKGTPTKPLPKAEPLDYTPLVAEADERMRVGLIDRLGNFFDRILRANRARALEPPPIVPQRPDPPVNTRPNGSRDRFASEPSPRGDDVLPRVREPEQRYRDPRADPYAYGYDGRYDARPRVRAPQPRFRGEPEYARERYAYPPPSSDSPPRRSYGYGYDPRDRGPYGGYDREPRRAPPRGYYDRRYRDD
jgi:penicillin-binding protein 1A